MWRWLLVRMLCLPGRVLSRRVMVRWLLLVALRARLVVWLRMRLLLRVLLGVLRVRRGRLTLVRWLLRVALTGRLRVLRLRRATLRMPLVMRLRRLVLVIRRCRRVMQPRAVLRRLLRTLAVPRWRLLVWIRWCPTLPVCWPVRLLTT